MTAAAVPVEAPARRVRMPELLSVLGQSVIWALAIWFVLAASSVSFLPSMLGYVPATVLTGSMSPTIKPGDVAWVRPIEKNPSYGLGSVVTFHMKPGESDVVSHRIIAMGTGPKGLITTQGDANGAPDDPIQREQIVGVVTPPAQALGLSGGPSAIPWLGYPKEFVRGHLLAVAGGAAAVVVVLWTGSALIERRRTSASAKED